MSPGITLKHRSQSSRLFGRFAGCPMKELSNLSVAAAFIICLVSVGLLAPVQTATAADTRLETRRTCSLAKSWNDKGSGADLDGFFYLPVVGASGFIIGGYGTRDKKITTDDCVLTVKASPGMIEPVGLISIWKDKGTGARLDGSMWQAVPPSTDYRCIGSIPQIGYKTPSVPSYRCVPAALTEKVITNDLIWTDEGSGAKKPVSMFKLPNSGSFVAVPGRLAQIETYDLKLTPPGTVTEDTSQAALQVAATPATETQSAPAAEPSPVSPAQPGVRQTGPPDEQDLQGMALALQQVVIDRADTAIQVLALIPGVSWLLPQTTQEHQRNDALKQIWGPFFENVVVEFHAADAPAPSVLYYNPLLDVALLTRWEKTELSYRLSALRVVPGERLSAADATVPAAPGWMTGETPIGTLYDTTVERLTTFRLGRIPEHIGNADQRYERAVRDLRVAQPRLEWNALQRTVWHSEENAWLTRTVTLIEKTFALGDAAALITQATETDPETATALVNLPTGLVDRLTLDMVLNYENEERLLVISLPDDGDFYIMAQCRLVPDEGLCQPSRYFLVGLGSDEEQATRDPV